MLISKPWSFVKTLNWHLVRIAQRNMSTTQELQPTVALKPKGLVVKVRDNPALKKIDTPEFQGIFTEELISLVDLFKKYNHELRIAGGAVRDILMEKKPKDLDFATTATPQQMKQMFQDENVRMINANGEKHGTITPRINNKENFEVTTLRIDARTDGRHADVVFTTDWQLDANRRDLTINSMYLGLDGTVYDYFYGYEDLQKRRVAFVGDASFRIQEDYLRILRYFRFYGRIADNPNSHEELTLEAIRNNVEGMARISGERTWSELQKIIVGNFAEELVIEMIKCGLAPYCGLPQEPNIIEFKRICKDLKDFPKPHHPILLMISLLNSVDDAKKMHERLKLSAFERDLALFITQERENVENESYTLLDYQKMCFNKFTNREFVTEMLKYQHKVELYNSFKTWNMPRFPLNGLTLKQRGCPGKKAMGQILYELKVIWANNNFQISSKELLDKHLPVLLAKLSLDSESPNKKVKTSN